MQRPGSLPSIGSAGDSYDNALAEAVNSLYKAELVRQQGPWRTVEEGRAGHPRMGHLVQHHPAPRHPRRHDRRPSTKPHVVTPGTSCVGPVCKLLEDDQIPYTQPGRHRRLRLSDVLDYRDRIRRERDRSLDELADLSDEAGLYEDDITRTRLRR